MRTTIGSLAAALLLHALPAASCMAQVVINEIMYAPESPEPEWVELFNGGASPVDLEGWSIRDASGTRAVLSSERIAAGGYVVITRDSAALRAARSVRGTVIEVSLPSLNNGGDLLALADSAGVVMDSVFYSDTWGGDGGRSLERRLHTFPGSIDSSWRTSASSTGATPGRRNSVTASGFDISIAAARFDAPASVAYVLVRNVGTLPTARARAALYFDADNDERPDASELLDSVAIPALPPGDSLLFTLVWRRALTETEEPGLVEIAMAGDERTGDNLAVIYASAPVRSGSVIINEIMFDPLPLAHGAGAEYVELRNIGGTPVDVSGWRLYDATLRARAAVRPETAPIAPGGYLAIASDTTIYVRFPWLRDSANVAIAGVAGFSLNADEDDLVLRNRGGQLVDEVHYRGDWHRSELGDVKGISLERISAVAASGDRRNWSSSAAAAGGTPGARNTLDIPVTVARAALSAAPQTFSPDGDGVDDFTRVIYHLPVPGARIILRALDRWGRPVRLIASNEPAAAEGEIVWDGRADGGMPLEPGIYLLLLEAYDEAGAGLLSARATVIIARRL
ncbi:MAG TPA: lamin tail domain-containing protein [Candidatus Kapabacteria bacterium]|nr:lamin tail domain-containing protein [Candidatus Kapabacteria bacterium]